MEGAMEAQDGKGKGSHLREPFLYHFDQSTFPLTWEGRSVEFESTSTWTTTKRINRYATTAAGEEGFEPSTFWLTARRSAVELLANRTNYYPILVEEVNIHAPPIWSVEYYLYDTLGCNKLCTFYTRVISDI